jgi:hypothetical protein
MAIHTCTRNESVSESVLMCPYVCVVSARACASICVCVCVCVCVCSQRQCVDKGAARASHRRAGLRRERAQGCPSVCVAACTRRPCPTHVPSPSGRPAAPPARSSACLITAVNERERERDRCHAHIQRYRHRDRHTQARRTPVQSAHVHRTTQVRTDRERERRTAGQGVSDEGARVDLAGRHTQKDTHRRRPLVCRQRARPHHYRRA